MDGLAPNGVYRLLLLGLPDKEVVDRRMLDELLRPPAPSSTADATEAVVAA